MAKDILGISLGTRTVGFAVLRDGELIDWKVKTFKGAWSKNKLSLIIYSILALCKFYQSYILAIKVIHPLHSSKSYRKLLERLELTAKKKNIRIIRYTLDELLEEKETRRRTKNHLMEAVTEKHYDLRKIYLKEINNLNPYYVKMFEAIAVAEKAHKEISQP